jgi:hypothetical protein
MINIGDFHFAKTPMEYIGGGRLGPETPYSLLLLVFIKCLISMLQTTKESCCSNNKE